MIAADTLAAQLALADDAVGVAFDLDDDAVDPMREGRATGITEPT